MKLASVELIHSIATHPNADTLLIAKVLGWPVVIKKDMCYKEGEAVVFIFPDVIVDKNNPEFAFMEKRKWRTWQAAFRQQPSAGLVMPITILPPGEYKEGDDVGEILKLTKYEKALDVKLAGVAKGNFPTKYIPISDEDNMRSYPAALTEFIGREVYISTKQDGSSFLAMRYNDEKHVCSRRLSLQEGDNAFWNVEKKYDILKKLDEFNLNLAIGGEVVGPKMNGNVLGLTELDLYIYRMKDLNRNVELGLDEMAGLCNRLGLKLVPVLQRFTMDASHDLAYFANIADNLKYPNGVDAEGIVLKPTEPVWSPFLQKNLSLKLINQNYKE